MRVRAIALFTAFLLLAHCRPGIIRCSHEPGADMDAYVYVSRQPRYTAFDPEDLVWHAEHLSYTTSANTQTTKVAVPLGKRAADNSTMYAHVYLCPHGLSPDPAVPGYDRERVSRVSQALVTYGPRPTHTQLRKLLTGERPAWQLELESVPPHQRGEHVAFWKPRLSINVVVDHERYSPAEVPHVLRHYWHEQKLFNRTSSKFKPILFLNELSLVKGQLVPLNASVPTVELELDAQPMSIRRFVWMLNLRQSMATQEEVLGISEKESEDLRSMFVDTPPALLYTTVAVSALHMLFDMLAFKNDISFWRSVESMEGLSSRSVIANFVMEAVILVYLVDEGASWLVQLGSAFTLIVGVFKIFKSLTVRRADKARAGGTSETDEYDRVAYRLLTPPVALLVVGYALYELVCDFHRGWWAWALNSLVALVYGVGFIVMTPQLFINYKLKSVAHLPWRFFFYKFLNTFIDDLFAFIIKMPTLHRMSCFRDDVVFICFLYQLWIYPVDRKRVNEYGQTGDAAEPPASRSGNAAYVPQSVTPRTSKSAKSKKAD